MYSYQIAFCATLAFLITMALAASVSSSVGESSSQFSKDFFNQIIASGGNENVVVSPASVQTCVALAFFGANGKTATEMANGLHFDTSDKNMIAKRFHNMLKSSANSKHLTIANKMYVSNEFHIKKSFNDVAIDSFESEAESINFSDNDQAVSNINNWVERKTNNNIKNLVQSVAPDTSMILVNAIHFKGEWKFEFDSLSTTDADFWTSPDTSIQVKTMINEDNYKYAEWTDLDAIAVDMEYKDSDLSMVIVLPNQRDGLDALEKKLTDIDLLSLSNKMTVEDVSLHLPKFQIESEFKLNDVLKKMGMCKMFSDSADFSDIFEEQTPMKVSEVVHKAFINVDEAGTEASAATYMKIVPMSLNMNQKSFIVDHPFLYFIKNQDTIYFMGHVKKF